MRHAAILIPLVLCVLFGFGCKKQDTRATPISTGSPESQVYLPPPPSPESDQVRNLRELQEALQNFERAKTFRAKLTLSTSDGTVTGQIDVMKPDRFHGTMQASAANGQSETSELIGVGDMLYVRVSADAWAYVKDSAKAKAYTQAFRSSIESQLSLLPQDALDSLQVTKTHDGSLGCEQYSTAISTSSSTSAALQVCVVNGLPKRITVSPKEGSATIDYFDYNKLFVIERPIGIYR
jgi:hypothetical protein